MDERAETFQRMFELADIASLPTIGGWTRKVQEMEQHVARGGTINEAGSFFVQASRGVDPALDRVIDFFSCLPKERNKAALVIALYCSPVMLDEYPEILGAIKECGVVDAGEGWRWPRISSSSAGRQAQLFWHRWARTSRRRYRGA